MISKRIIKASSTYFQPRKGIRKDIGLRVLKELDQGEESDVNFYFLLDDWHDMPNLGKYEDNHMHESTHGGSYPQTLGRFSFSTSHGKVPQTSLTLRSSIGKVGTRQCYCPYLRLIAEEALRHMCRELW